MARRIDVDALWGEAIRIASASLEADDRVLPAGLPTSSPWTLEQALGS